MKFINFMEFDKRCKEISKLIKTNKKIKNIFGILRGGMIVALRVSYLTKLPITLNPKFEETAIIDDFIEGEKHSFSEWTHFYTLIDETENVRNIKFWWEEK